MQAMPNEFLSRRTLLAAGAASAVGMSAAGQPNASTSGPSKKPAGPLAPPDKQPPDLDVPQPVERKVGFAVVGLGDGQTRVVEQRGCVAAVVVRGVADVPARRVSIDAGGDEADFVVRNRRRSSIFEVDAIPAANIKPTAKGMSAAGNDDLRVKRRDDLPAILIESVELWLTRPLREREHDVARDRLLLSTWTGFNGRAR